VSAREELERWVRARGRFTVDELAGFARERSFRLRTLLQYLWAMEKEGKVRKAGRGRWEVAKPFPEGLAVARAEGGRLVPVKVVPDLDAALEEVRRLLLGGCEGAAVFDAGSGAGRELTLRLRVAASASVVREG
jgi:hypothetical protein